MLFTALHRLLGQPPGPITNELIDGAVAAGLAETDDLDWKSELPPTKALSETDFPKDIAAMANSGGGVIVYGIEEAQKSATGRKDVGELSENHERTLRAAAYNAVTPPIFGLGVHRVGAPGNRVVAVVVPASVDGPHLIFKDKFFGAPVRNDADTVWMKERQIEAAYRARLEQARHSAEVLRSLYDEANTNWNDRERVWIVAVAHPRIPITTGTRPTREQAIAMLQAAKDYSMDLANARDVHPLDNVDRFRPRPGLRRWVAPNTSFTDNTRWRAAWAALHDDGSVTLAASVGGHRTRGADTLPLNVVESFDLECAVANFMALIRANSTHHGISEYEIRLGLEWGGAKPIIIPTVDNLGFAYDGNSTPLERFAPISGSVVADAPWADFHWQVHDLVQDCINQGGLTTVQVIDPPPREP